MQEASSVAVSLIALVTEATVGYPPSLFQRIGHPVKWIGALIVGLDQRLNREDLSSGWRTLAGLLALLIVLGVVGASACAIESIATAFLAPAVAVFLLGVLASSCLAQRSLDTHVGAVRDALRDGGLPAGREAVAMIVGRDTSELDEAGIARAAIESLAESFADGIVAPTFFILLGGLAGGIFYKAINTADSMIGHRTPRFEAFGFAAAKLDDLVNVPAARIAAFWIVLAAAFTPGASARGAWRIMRRDARGHASPNAGWPEAAMAGALGITLGGPRAYAGRTVFDTTMGDGGQATRATIDQALALYRRACVISVLVICAIPIVIRS